jgi:hypothetical protein
MRRISVVKITAIYLLFMGIAYADDPLDHLTGTEEWDREEELKRQAMILAQKKRMMSDEFYSTRTRVSSMVDEWQRDLSKFQEIKRTLQDLVFEEEAKSYKQVNVKEMLIQKDVKRMPAKTGDISIETGGPLIEKEKTSPKDTKVQSAPEQVVVPVQTPKKEEQKEPTSEEILKKQSGHFDEKGQFVDEELKNESKSSTKDKDVDYDSP